MIYCKLVDGVVADRALFDGPMPEDWPDRALWCESDEAQIGWRYDGGIFIPPDPSPEPELQSYRLYKSTFVERMEPEEAEKLELAMLAEEAKLRLLYQSVEYFVSDDILFDILHMTVAMTLSVDGETPNMDRADELLAPEN